MTVMVYGLLITYVLFLQGMLCFASKHNKRFFKEGLL